jgi:hypothetical protein
VLGNAIPLQLQASGPAIEIDGALVAGRLGLSLAEFRQLMEQRRIVVLCERGTGEDSGRYRATFYYDDRRTRLVVDREGRVVGSGE